MQLQLKQQLPRHTAEFVVPAAVHQFAAPTPPTAPGAPRAPVGARRTAPAPAPVPVLVPPPLPLLDSVLATELARHGRWVCRPIGSTGAGAPAYVFDAGDSDVISRCVYTRLDVVLPGCRGVVNFCSRTVCFAGAGTFELEFVFPRARYAPWAPTLLELEACAHGQEYYADIARPLYHWAWWNATTPRPTDPIRLSLVLCHPPHPHPPSSLSPFRVYVCACATKTELEESPRWVQFDGEQEERLESLWRIYAKDASRREHMVSGLGHVDLGTLTLTTPMKTRKDPGTATAPAAQAGAAAAAARSRREGTWRQVDLARVSYVWQWRAADGAWVPFGYEACATLESALAGGETTVYLDSAAGVASDVCVNLVEMCLFPADSALVRHDVQRLGTPFSLAFRKAFLLRGANVKLRQSTPGYWQRVVAPDVRRLAVTLPVASPEARRVQALLLSSSSRGSTAVLTLVRLERVQDVDMWLTFAARRNQAVLEHRSDVPSLQFSRYVAAALVRAPVVERQSNELYLFHACDGARARSLVDGACDFDQHFRASHTPVLGPGYFFYESAARAALHAPPPAGAPRTRTLLLCRVVLGGGGTVYTDSSRRQFLSSLRASRRIPDAVLRNTGDGSFEVVVYDNLQVYPEYVVTCAISEQPPPLPPPPPPLPRQQQARQQQQQRPVVEGADESGVLDELADELNRMVEVRLPALAVARAPHGAVLLPVGLRPARPAGRVLAATQRLLQALDELDAEHHRAAHRLLVAALDEDGDCLPAQMLLVCLQSSHPLLARDSSSGISNGISSSNGIISNGSGNGTGPVTHEQLRDHLRRAGGECRARWGDVVRARAQAVPRSPTGLFLRGEWDMLVAGAAAAGARSVRESAELGGLFAAALLGGALLAGDSGRVVLATAPMARHCRAAAVRGHAHAQCVLAANLHAGSPAVAADPAAARRWWRASARNGLPEACYRLAASLALLCLPQSPTLASTATATATDATATTTTGGGDGDNGDSGGTCKMGEGGARQTRSTARLTRQRRPRGGSGAAQSAGTRAAR